MLYRDCFCMSILGLTNQAYLLVEKISLLPILWT